MLVRIPVRSKRTAKRERTGQRREDRKGGKSDKPTVEPKPVEQVKRDWLNRVEFNDDDIYGKPRRTTIVIEATSHKEAQRILRKKLRGIKRFVYTTSKVPRHLRTGAAT
jgi:hypothetical protein